MITSKKAHDATNWSDSELWAWGEIKAGREANFNKRYNQRLNPKKAKEWDTSEKDRMITPDFLIEILTHKELTAMAGKKGVCIIGAYFKEALDLRYIKFGHQFWLDECRFLESLDFSFFKVDDWFSLEGSFLAKDLILEGAVLGGVNLAIHIMGTTKLNDTQLSGGLIMSNGFFSGPVELAFSNIQGYLELNGSQFKGGLIMDSMEVGKDLDLSNMVSFKKMSMSSSHIGRNVYLNGDGFHEELNMSAVEVGKDLLIGNANIEQVTDFPDQYPYQVLEGLEEFPKIDLRFCKIKGDLEIRNVTSKKDLDLAFSQVGGKLLLHHISFDLIDLYNSTVSGNLEINEPNYSDKLSLQGLTYASINIDENTTSTSDKIINCKSWLGTDEEYHPQPYEFMAKYHNAIGYPAIASKLRFASKERRRKNAWLHGELRSWVGLTLSKLFIGYGLGYGYFWALLWFLGLSFIGCIVLLHYGNDPTVAFSRAFWASFDNSLPLLTLNNGNNEVLFENQGDAVIIFFYVQKLFGFVLGGFLVAGLSGLTQKS